jgi:callose synthase
VFYSKSRLYSGLVAGALSGFLSFTFLEPLFEPVGLKLAEVAHYVLALDGALVGLALGVMLPTVFPGVCFGASLALFIGSFGAASMPLFFPIVGGSLVLISAVASVR